MNTDVAKMKAKLTAFFDTATPEDISALLCRTNYDFYKDVKLPAEAWFDIDFNVTETSDVLMVEIPVTAGWHRRVPNRPIVYIGRGSPMDHERLTLAVDHQDVALAA